MGTEERYVEVNALMEDRIWKCGGDPYDPYYMGYQDALDNVEVTIDNQPTADVVKVVRCKNCICHEDSSLRGKVWCLKMCRYMAEDGYCSESKNI